MTERDAAPEFEPGRLITPPPAWALENKLPPARPGQLRLALTGGIATGKSTVARVFADLGAREIDLDLLAGQAMEPGGGAFPAALEIFGPEAVLSGGGLNRPFLRRIIFGDPLKKAAWEGIVHPCAWRLLCAELRAMADEKAVVISVPLLFEAGLESFFSPIIVVFASPAAQLERILLRSPEMGEEEAQKIINAQWPAAAKLRAAHHIINNGGGLDETVSRARGLWDCFFPPLAG